MRISTWNVNGIRAVMAKGLKEWILAESPDVLCLQEIKAKEAQVEIDLPSYFQCWNSAERPGYSGTAIFTKFKPLTIIKIILTNYIEEK